MLELFFNVIGVCLSGAFPYHWLYYTTHFYPLQPPILTFFIKLLVYPQKRGKLSVTNRGTIKNPPGMRVFFITTFLLFAQEIAKIVHRIVKRIRYFHRLGVLGNTPTSGHALPYY